MSLARYTVDLPRHMAQCDANYWRLRCLLPDLARDDRRVFGVDWAGWAAQVDIDVTERSPYTTTLRVRQSGPCRWSGGQELTVRMYHDARTAEVLACGEERPREGRYGYPNPRMYQRDEKTQLNVFLGEWLTHCLVHGRLLDLGHYAGAE